MGYYPQESLYKPYKYHGYTVRGTPNCPLNQVLVEGLGYGPVCWTIFRPNNGTPKKLTVNPVES